MKMVIALLGSAAALAACTFTADDGMVDNVENSVRDGLAAQGTVKQVELNREGDGRMSGHAVVALNNPPGVEARFTCTAQRQGETGTTYNWECRPPELDK